MPQKTNTTRDGAEEQTGDPARDFVAYGLQHVTGGYVSLNV